MRLPGPLLTLLFALAPVPAAADTPLRTDHLDSRLVAAETAVVPGSTLRLGLWLRHDPEWHTYWRNPGDSGLPTRIMLELPPGFAAGEIQWPVPERLPVPPLVNFGYSDTLVLPLDVTVPAGFAGSELVIEARADWLICRVECLPGEGRYTLRLPVAASAATDPRWADVFAAAERRQPVPAPAAASVSYTAETVELRLPRGLSPGPGPGWTYFPVTAQVTSNAVAPRWLDTAGGTALVLPKSDYFVSPPERFEFLLAQGDTGLLFTALPGEPDAAAAGATGPGPAGGAPGLLAALGLALLGGLLLNLMPCVFPVLFLKAAGAMEAGGDRALLRRHGLLYTAGVVASFVVVAGVLLALRASGEALGWGFQLQAPPFVAALVLLFFVMAMNFAGLFEFSGRLAGAGQRLAQGRGDRAAFFTGMLACLVASPCTAPFMGVALGVALTLPVPGALAIFAALGLGLALPILLLGWVPGLARRLPRPGPWMDTFRRLLAFPLLLTVVWLLWVYGEQTGVLAMSWLLAALVGVAFGLWLLRFGGAWRVPARGVLAACLVLPLLQAPAPGTPGPATAEAG
ncbi:protein-disulfide reductase DsbD domain-containing protein, partial [Thioalkalivibrio sp. XN8]|uniref:cytochrome c biogenesis protein CcdA n=1 Tax=Thioalkalivibrio sp. XN8 TaxID=2712863 RepID=UPI0013EC952A